MKLLFDHILSYRPHPRLSKFGRRTTLVALLAVIAFRGILPQSACAQAPKVEPSGRWCVLVHSMVSPSDPMSWSLGDHERTKWATIISNGETTKRTDGLIATIAGRLFYIKIKTIKHSEYCRKHNHTSAYEVDQLVAQPVGGGPSAVLLGQAELSSAQKEMAEFRILCKGKEPLRGRSGMNYDSYQAIINPLSIYRNYLSVEYRSNFFPGGVHPLHETEWCAYSIASTRPIKVAKNKLSPAIFRQAESEFEGLGEEVRESFDPPDFSQFALVPSEGGVMVQFGLPHQQEIARGSVCSLEVVQSAGLGDQYDKTRLSFVSKHPRLIPWKEASDYTIAPDASAVVYCQNDRLFWQGLTGKARVLGQAENVRGWQWFREPSPGSTLMKTIGF